MCSADIFLGLLAIVFPPLPVWVKTGICSADSLINILLCLLGFLPGLVHAWYIIAKFPEPEHDYERVQQDAEGGRVTYVFVSSDGRQHLRGPKPQKPMNYGSTNAQAGNSSSSRPQQQPPHDNGGEGRSDGAPPPSYAQVVSGDHKVQSQD